ncbi:thiol:disulfide interchange protein, putative [Shewanella sp. ANA-3]|uniref:Thiol:disulfide interchange protein, putative n=1 Tax=Shewanella sp. (strain MR-7) TaxID=60481 RepID=Q0HRY7_SHESR|nr:thioredoxin family protein [Shewanella sp. ANA-3]ABK49450.1 thiol:disulfide interchange protein, putative [Shewanella sp. ANA-3]
MGTITLISLVILALLVGAISLLIWQRSKGKRIPLAVIFVLGFFAVGLGGIIGFVHKGEDYQAYQKLQWHTLAPEKIAPLVADGYTVFVDITSDWCSICQTNKAEVTHREQVVNALMADKVILMQGNWSEADSTIAGYMKHEGVPGTPYNKVYGPRAPNGIVLPSTLTIEAVLNGLAQAKAL